VHIAALGHMVSGSGFEEIIIEAGIICASGSLHQVLTGKHYNWALRVHHHMIDAINRLLLQAFLDLSGFSEEDLSEIQLLASSPSDDTLLAETSHSEACVKFLEAFSVFVSNTQGGSLGKTAQFWINYTDSVWALLRFLRAIKENDLPSYTNCLRSLCPLLLSADRLNYAHYLPMYYRHLVNISQTHPGAEALLERYGFSVARSSVPACRVPVDMAIEQTINKSAKTSGGIIGFTKNMDAYRRWCITQHERASFLDATQEHLEIRSKYSTLRSSCSQYELKSSNAEVNRLVTAFGNFINQFRIPDSSCDFLYCISSGQPASEEAESDLLGYIKKGEDATAKFIRQRLETKEVKFHDTMKKMHLQTFKSMVVEDFDDKPNENGAYKSRKKPFWSLPSAGTKTWTDDR